MTFFYLKHHYFSVVRSKSFSGEVFAFVFLGVMSLNFSSFFIEELDSYVAEVASFLELGARSFEAFLIVYVIFDLLIKVLLKRPKPKSHYYLFLVKNTKAISWQYLITSLFGIVPFMLLVPQLAIILKVDEWIGGGFAWIVFVLFLSNHYLALTLQFSGKKTERIFLAVASAVMVLILTKLISIGGLAAVMLTPTYAVSVLVVALVLAFLAVDAKLKAREVFNEKSGFSLFDLIPTLNFKNPLFQLEWALIARNKRTRSNILLGVLSIMILPFLLDQDSPEIVVLLLTLFCTSFFIVQHGVYSLGWEGSYFDFLVTNVSLKSFVEGRYLFYLGTCVLGLVLFMLPMLLTGQDVVLLICMFLYNVGITIPLVLYRSGFNSQKIELSENSFMNYNGMMTGPIMVTSLMVVVSPFIFYGIGQIVFGENAAYALALVGIAGIVARPVLLNGVIRSLSKRKYHLSQSFKS